MKEYVEKIREKALSENRTEYENALEKYRKYLLKEIEKNSRDVSAVCQLAGVCYLIRKYDKIEILEMFLKKNFNSLTNSEKFRIYIDLGYLCEYMGSMEEKAISYLEKAIKVNSENADTYYRLSVIYSLNKMNQKALESIKIACKISNEEKYNYGYALILIQNKKYEKAIKILNILLEKDSKNIKYHFYRVLCEIYLGNKNIENIKRFLEKIKEFEILEEKNYQKYIKWITYKGFDIIGVEEIGDLFYLCDDYEKYCKYADNSNFYLEANSIAPYLYSLKQLRKFEKINKIVKKAEKEILQNIEDIKNDEECQKNMTEEEILEIIKSEKKRLANINLVSEKILNTDFKPKMEITMFFKYECWMADCPQHLIIDEN
jgi:tetratricopeptide repeat protein